MIVRQEPLDKCRGTRRPIREWELPAIAGGDARRIGQEQVHQLIFATRAPPYAAIFEGSEFFQPAAASPRCW